MKVLRWLLKFFFFKVWLHFPGHKKIMKHAARKFIAGESREEALALIEKLNKEGFWCTVNYIGDHTDSRESAEKSIAEYAALLREIGTRGLKAGVSLKLSSVGVLSDTLPHWNMISKFMSLIKQAKRDNVAVCIDREEIKHDKRTDIVVSMARCIWPVGSVIQAYNKDWVSMIHEFYITFKMFPGQSFLFRVCKGAYSEPKHLVYTRSRDISRQFRLWVGQIMHGERQYGGQHIVQVATHDRKNIAWVKKFFGGCEDYKNYRSRLEFAMLLGVDMKLAAQLRDEGYRVVIYIPYGEDVEGYCIRRIIEKPKYILLPVKAVFKAFF